MSTDYDPDEFSLTKQDVIEIMDGIQDYWKQDIKANWQYISAIKLMKAGIKMTPEKAVVKIWNSLLKLVFHLQYQNALAHMSTQKGSDDHNWGKIINKLKSKQEISKILDGV